MLPALDSNAFTYLVEAVYGAYDPLTDSTGLAPERVAMIRTMLYSRPSLWVGPEVQAQFQRISKPPLRKQHEELFIVHLDEGGVDSDDPVVKQRALDLQLRHSDLGDCRIVAEAEARGCSFLLTCDDRLTARLGAAAGLEIVKPTAYWERLGIAKGAPPKMVPAPSNPLGSVTWWRW